MSTAAAATADLQTALNHAQLLLRDQPALAAEQAQEILRLYPDQPNALMLLAMAQRATQQHDASFNSLQLLLRVRSDWPAAHFEYGQALRQRGQFDEAIAAYQHALSMQVDIPKAWQALGDCYLALGDSEQAQHAYLQQVRYSSNDKALLQAADALATNELPVAERLLKQYLLQHPTNASAIRMLAEVAARLGRQEDAEALLERCVELVPDFKEARLHYALVLNRSNKPQLALEQVNLLLADDAKNISNRNLKAVLLGQIGEYEQSIALYENVLKDFSTHPKVWLSYAHALKTAGHTQRAIEAYRECIRLQPDFGEAYWSLANLKTFRFSSEEIEKMRAHLKRSELSVEDRYHFEFSLGKAMEDAQDYAPSFKHYEEANRLRRNTIQYSADEHSKRTDRSIDVLNAEFFAARQGVGHSAPDPIFIVGMPRAGSTLVEQILSSHSMVEGTMELPDIIAITRRLRMQSTDKLKKPYVDLLGSLSADEFQAMGQTFIRNTQIHRKLGRAFFIDKMPNNFAHVGLIHLILPNAKIIDARRHPLACCFSNFKQHFARGQNFSYSLHDMGRYYADYVRLMAHYDRVLPGRVHRVHYENMVSDTDAEVRRLLDYCGLAFEQNCLRFFENERPVRTASSEQVRQPIYKEGVDHWRHYDAWLSPLRDALGEVLTIYPDVPAFSFAPPVH
jgi:tetratricopeptide (TPR) repeat protein